MRITGLKPLVLATLIASSSLVGTASAQTFSLNWNPRSGDVWVDSRLSDINRYGMDYRDPFVNEMVRYNGAPRDLVTQLLVQRRWAPGDVYYACAIAQIIGRPCGYVADYWQQNHGQGWGVVAQRLGIKPGSAQFHRLKKGFVPTYDRWSRPVTLDAELRRAYPSRGKSNVSNGNAGSKSKAVGNGNAKVKSQPAAKGDKGGNGKGNNKGGNGKGNGKN